MGVLFSSPLTSVGWQPAVIYDGCILWTFFCLPLSHSHLFLRCTLHTHLLLKTGLKLLILITSSEFTFFLGSFSSAFGFSLTKCLKWMRSNILCWIVFIRVLEKLPMSRKELFCCCCDNWKKNCEKIQTDSLSRSGPVLISRPKQPVR